MVRLLRNRNKWLTEGSSFPCEKKGGSIIKRNKRSGLNFCTRFARISSLKYPRGYVTIGTVNHTREILLVSGLWILKKKGRFKKIKGLGKFFGWSKIWTELGRSCRVYLSVTIFLFGLFRRQALSLRESAHTSGL